MTEGKVIPFAGSLRGRFIPSLRHSDWMARSTILLHRFKIEIVGNDLAKDVLVEIDWLGKWDTIVGRQVHEE